MINLRTVARGMSRGARLGHSISRPCYESTDGVRDGEELATGEFLEADVQGLLLEIEALAFAIREDKPEDHCTM